MSVSDPIANALTKIRNALQAKHFVVVLPKSKLFLRLVEILKQEGYVEDFITKRRGKMEDIHIALKYETDGTPVIEEIKRVSTPGRRVYKASDELPEVLGGLGVAIVSTSKGIMTAADARKQGVGGEVICTVF